MALRKVTAEIVCDGCAARFKVDLDPADKWTGSLHSLIIDTIRGKLDISYQGEHALCEGCTKLVDAAFGDDHEVTCDEVAAVLDKSILGHGRE